MQSSSSGTLLTELKFCRPQPPPKADLKGSETSCQWNSELMGIAPIPTASGYASLLVEIHFYIHCFPTKLLSNQWIDFRVNMLRIAVEVMLHND